VESAGVASAGAGRGGRDELLDHEFDGIREYDNPPPPWIMMLLYGSLVFAVGYWMYYHTFGVGSLPHKDYAVEVGRAAEQQLAKMSQQELSDASLLLMSQVPAQVAEGKQVYDQFCVACHTPDGSGSVGPNLTDGYWLHGGRPMQIHHTVTHGVPDKGMVAWQNQLGPARIQKVVAYLLTMKNTNRPGKAPQGEPEAAATEAPAPDAGGAPAAAPATTPAAAGAPAGAGS